MAQDATQSLLDTERFCFAECQPAMEDSVSGSPCTVGGGRRKLRRKLRKPAPVALAREEKPDKVKELLAEAKRQAVRAEKAAVAVPWRSGVGWACRGAESEWHRHGG